MQTFEETQSFTQWWIWLLLIGGACFPIYGIIKQVILGNPVGSRPLSNTGMILLALFTAALLLFFFFLKLQTKIDDKGIQLNYFPLSKKDIKWEQIESTMVIDYGFAGGWGIRYSSKYGTVYNLSLIHI